MSDEGFPAKGSRGSWYIGEQGPFRRLWPGRLPGAKFGDGRMAVAVMVKQKEISGSAAAPPTAEALRAHFGLKPHPEGGHYLRTYASSGRIPAQALPAPFGGERLYSTAIVYLLEAGQKSHLHRIRQDELWHFHLGGPLRLVMISPGGKAAEILLGPEVLVGQRVQFAVPAGFWFGATPAPGAAYSLVGCTVAPGFDFADFELAERAALQNQFPRLEQLIAEFTSPTITPG